MHNANVRLDMPLGWKAYVTRNLTNSWYAFIRTNILFSFLRHTCICILISSNCIDLKNRQRSLQYLTWELMRLRSCHKFLSIAYLWYFKLTTYVGSSHWLVGHYKYICMREMPKHLILDLGKHRSSLYLSRPKCVAKLQVYSHWNFSRHISHLSYM